MIAVLVAASLAWGGPHADQVAELGAVAPRGPALRPLPEPTTGPEITVYGYQAYWSDDLGSVPWDHLSHIALFAAEVQPDGSLTSTSRWDEAATAVALAEPYGVHVHLCVINFSSSEIATIVGSASARARLISELQEHVEASGAHGVNIDFEGLPSSSRADMVTFAAELDAAFDEVVFATPSVDWSGAWDFGALTDHADLFIMGYGYHWSGSDQAGPSDPLYGGGPWASWSLSKSVETYVDDGADPSRVILGLPLYGKRWPTVDGEIASDTTGRGESIFWAEAQAEAATHGVKWDPVSHTPWWYDGSRQGWYGHAESVRDRVAWARDAGIAGVGFWALHYDEGDEDLWQVMRDETFPPDDDPGGDDTGDPGGADEFSAYAGEPFLAYVGDTVILSATGSAGPEGTELRYRWTQAAGPTVSLSTTTGPKPAFAVTEPGTTVFDLWVGDGERWSAPARSYVVVVDRNAGRRHAIGCTTLPSGAAWLALLPLVALRRRRD